jgi:hypothetical protein
MLGLRYYRQRRSDGNGDLFRVPLDDSVPVLADLHLTAEPVLAPHVYPTKN